MNTVLQQIEEKGYGQGLVSHGLEEGHIFKYGFAFKGKKGFDWLRCHVERGYIGVFAL